MCRIFKKIYLSRRKMYVISWNKHTCILWNKSCVYIEWCTYDFLFWTFQHISYKTYFHIVNTELLSFANNLCVLNIVFKLLTRQMMGTNYIKDVLRLKKKYLFHQITDYFNIKYIKKLYHIIYQKYDVEILQDIQLTKKCS